MDISFDHFKTMDLRVGEIKTVEDIEGADRIYKISVDIGEERTIIAGIKAFYSKEELIGKKVVVLANLEPKTIRGNESQGMLLAAVKEDPRTLTVLTIDRDMPNGSRVS